MSCNLFIVNCFRNLNLSQLLARPITPRFDLISWGKRYSKVKKPHVQYIINEAPYVFSLRVFKHNNNSIYLSIKSLRLTERSPLKRTI